VFFAGEVEGAGVVGGAGAGEVVGEGEAGADLGGLAVIGEADALGAEPIGVDEEGVSCFGGQVAAANIDFVAALVGAGVGVDGVVAGAILLPAVADAVVDIGVDGSAGILVGSGIGVGERGAHFLPMVTGKGEMRTRKSKGCGSSEVRSVGVKS